MVATPHANCYLTGALHLYKTNDALLYQFMEVHMQMGLVWAKMGNVCKSCVGEMIATPQRNWCLRSAASLRFPIESV
jgi:hypothetical protein